MNIPIFFGCQCRAGQAQAQCAGAQLQQRTLAWHRRVCQHRLTVQPRAIARGQRPQQQLAVIAQHQFGMVGSDVRVVDDDVVV